MGVDVILFVFFLFFLASKISSPTIAGRKRTHDEGTAYSLSPKPHSQAIFFSYKMVWEQGSPPLKTFELTQEHTSFSTI